jgi:hypothetical protein
MTENIPLYEYMKLWLSIHQLMGIWAVSTISVNNASMNIHIPIPGPLSRTVSQAVALLGPTVTNI